MRINSLTLAGLCLLALSSSARSAGLVNNVGVTGEDRHTWLVQNWDSTGTRRVGADSFYVACFGPSGDTVFTAAYDTSATQLRPFFRGNDSVYTYSDWIANLDGAGSPGVYLLEVRAVQTSTALNFVNAYEFQIIGIDFSAGLIDTLLNKDSLIVKAIADDAITDAAIAPNAVDIDEFGGTLAATQIENDALTAAHIAGDVAREIADTVRHDSLAYQGSAGSPAAIADAVWDEDRTGHTAASTFGYFLDAPVSLVGGGGLGGAYPCSVWVANTVGGLNVSGIDVRISNLSGARVAAGRTGAEGFAEVLLDDGVWQVTAVAPGWSIAPGSLTVAGGGTADTIYATPFDPGVPAVGLCRVYGYVYDIGGDSLSGVSVTARLVDGPARAGSVIVSPFRRSVTSDVHGYFYLDLIPNTLLTPPGSHYEISASLADGAVVRTEATVPDQASWQLTW